MENISDYERLLDLLITRRSVRRFSGRAVPKELLERVLEAARQAPSAGNRQGYRFLVVSSRSLVEAMAAAVRQATSRISVKVRGDLAPDYLDYIRNFEHFTEAPVVVVPIFRCGPDLLTVDDPDTGQDPSASQRPLIDGVSSVAASIMSLTLAAHSLGLATCWMTGPLIAARDLRRLLKVPEGWEIAALVPVGFAAENPPPTSRRPLSRLVRHL